LPVLLEEALDVVVGPDDEITEQTDLVSDIEVKIVVKQKWEFLFDECPDFFQHTFFPPVQIVSCSPVKAAGTALTI
jgi:hypothetical protein